MTSSTAGRRTGQLPQRRHIDDRDGVRDNARVLLARNDHSEKTLLFHPRGNARHRACADTSERALRDCDARPLDRLCLCKHGPQPPSPPPQLPPPPPIPIEGERRLACVAAMVGPCGGALSSQGSCVKTN